MLSNIVKLFFWIYATSLGNSVLYIFLVFLSVSLLEIIFVHTLPTNYFTKDCMNYCKVGFRVSTCIHDESEHNRRNFSSFLNRHYDQQTKIGREQSNSKSSHEKMSVKLFILMTRPQNLEEIFH